MKRQSLDETRRDPKEPTQFGPAIIAPGVTDPAALSYAQQIQQRRGPPKFAPPVAGGPTQGMPRLDAQAAEGLTMAEQAAQQRAAQDPPVFGPHGSMFQEPAPALGIPARPPASGLSTASGIMPTDILPPEAMQDPAFREGHGSRYASSQPELAYKYGVIRGNSRIPPQQLAQARPSGLSSKSVEDLQRLQQLQTGQAHPLVDPPEKQAEIAAAGSHAGAAARIAGGTETGSKMTQEEALEAARKLDDFDFNAFRERMMKDLLNNDDQRKIIESRLTPLSIDDLVMKGFATQRVPIIPNKFEPTFKSMGADEDLAIKRLVMLESKALEVSDRYLLDKFSLMSVVLGVHAINGNPLPNYQDQNGVFNDDLFWKKFNYLTRNSFHMLASLGVNYYWFDIRVRTLFVAEKLGNG